MLVRDKSASLLIDTRLFHVSTNISISAFAVDAASVTMALIYNEWGGHWAGQHRY